MASSPADAAATQITLEILSRGRASRASGNIQNTAVPVHQEGMCVAVMRHSIKTILSELSLLISASCAVYCTWRKSPLACVLMSSQFGSSCRTVSLLTLRLVVVAGVLLFLCPPGRPSHQSFFPHALV